MQDESTHPESHRRLERFAEFHETEIQASILGYDITQRRSPTFL